MATTPTHTCGAQSPVKDERKPALSPNGGNMSLYYRQIHGQNAVTEANQQNQNEVALLGHFDGHSGSHESQR